MSDDEKPTAFRYPESYKKKRVEEFIQAQIPISHYLKGKSFSKPSFLRWLRQYHQEPRPSLNPKYFSLETRMKIIEEYLKSNISRHQFGKIWGVSATTLVRWLKAYEKFGAKGLEVGKVNEIRKENELAPKPRGRKKVLKKIEEVVIEKKKSFPEFGLKKLHDSLIRFQAIKVSTGTIKRILQDENLHTPPEPQKTKRKPDQIRRFERAHPMQLWQSDITSYLIGRENTRAYLVVFMDDNSRYIVAWSLSYKQTGEFVMQTLLDGITKFGKPHEVLTDQGRQYFSWRGKSEFQRLLINQGIEHVVARSHHPQTLGKCERFWKTVGTEFWDRARPKNIDEAKEKFAHFVNHYNHFRPHQGLDGMIPADRFFGVENEVRSAIEQSLSENELRLAIDESPKKPVFLFGQIGDQKVSLHGESGKLIFQSQSGSSEEINYEEFGHGNSKNSRSENESRREYISTDYNQEKARTEDYTDHSENSDSDSLFVDDGHSRREETIERDCAVDYGLLDGTSNETRNISEAWCTASEDLADEPDGPFGNVCSDASSTKREENYAEERRRSNRFEEEDLGTGKNNQNTGSIDRDTKVDAGMYASWSERNKRAREERQSRETESDEEERDEGWEKESTAKYESTWDFFWWKKD